MHIFHPRVSRMFKNAAAQRLRYSTHNTDHYRTMEWTTRSFSSLLTALLQKNSTVLDEICKYAYGTRIVLYLRDIEGHQGLTGVFKDGRLAGILHTADIKKIDMLLPFIGHFSIVYVPNITPVQSQLFNVICGHN